jgi:hypothetical protein
MSKQTHTAGSYFCSARQTNKTCSQQIHLLASMSVDQDYAALGALGWTQRKGRWLCKECSAPAKDQNDG